MDPVDVDPTSDEPAEATALDHVLSSRAVTATFRPIVDLAARQVVAFASCGPIAGRWDRPDLLLAAARRAGRLEELDYLFRSCATEAIAQSGIHSPFAVFVRRDSDAAAAAGPSARALTTMRRRGLRLILVITERDLARAPADLLALADSIRRNGMGIALDVGVDADALALVPFLMPDVVNLNVGLLQRRPDGATVQVLSAVRAHCERRGALILAEGIDTLEHERLAVALGAVLGQGRLYGPPAPLPGADSGPTLTAPSRPLALRDSDDELAVASPFAMATATRAALRGPMDLVMALREQLRRSVRGLDGLAVALATALDRPDTDVDDSELAEHARYSVVLGAEASRAPVSGVHHSQLAADDPVRDEWDMVVVSPHFAGAVIARERRDPHPEEGRVFDYVLTYDRTLVVDVARTLMMRALPLPARRLESAADRS